MLHIGEQVLGVIVSIALMFIFVMALVFSVTSHGTELGEAIQAAETDQQTAERDVRAVLGGLTDSEGTDETH